MLLADDFAGTCDPLREIRPRSRAIRLTEGARFNYQREGIARVGGYTHAGRIDGKKSRLRMLDAV